MPTVQNTSNEAQAIGGFPAFAAGEKREVTADEAVILGRNPNIAVYANGIITPNVEAEVVDPDAKKK